MRLSERFFDCPYCGERVSVLVDHSEPFQAYVEDCEVCCRPIEISCSIGDADEATLDVARGDT